MTSTPSKNGNSAGIWSLIQVSARSFEQQEQERLSQPSIPYMAKHEVVPSARYFGVDIASDLSWKPHIARITNSANKSLGFLQRNLKAKSPEIREIAYKASVCPQLEYAAPVWDPHIQEDIQGIQMVQRRVARWVLSDYSPYSSVSDMLGRLGWRILEQQHVGSRLVLF